MRPSSPRSWSDRTAGQRRDRVESAEHAGGARVRRGLRPCRHLAVALSGRRHIGLAPLRRPSVAPRRPTRRETTIPKTKGSYMLALALEDTWRAGGSAIICLARGRRATVGPANA